MLTDLSGILGFPKVLPKLGAGKAAASWAIYVCIILLKLS